MKNNRISGLADPTENTDAVNLRSMQNVTNALQGQVDSNAAKIAANSAQIKANKDKINELEMLTTTQGSYEKKPSTYPSGQGEFTTLNSGQSSTNSVTGIRNIWLADRNAAGSQINIGAWSGDVVQFVDEDGETFAFPFVSKNSGAPNAQGVTFWNFTVAGGVHTGGATEMPANTSYFFKLEGLASPASASTTTRNLMLTHPVDEARSLDDGTAQTQEDANEFFTRTIADARERIDALEAQGSGGGGLDMDAADARYAPLDHSHPLYAAVSHTHPDYADKNYVDSKDEATREYVDTEIAKIEGSGGATINETHMLGGKGSWHNSHQGVPNERFYGLNYSDSGRNYLDDFTYGIVVGHIFGNESTTSLGWQNGAWIEVYASDGSLIFAHEIDRVRYDSQNQLNLLWDRAPTMYKGDSLSYGQTLWLKIHGLTNRESRGKPPKKLAPPEDRL